MNIIKQDNQKIKGELEFKVTDKYGSAKKLWNENWLGKYIRTKLGRDIQGFFLFGRWDKILPVRNLTPNVAKAAAASRFNGAGGEAAFTFLTVGTGTTAAAATDTALQAEITTGGLARAAATASRVTTTVTNDTAQLEHTWTATATHSVTEAGAFNAATGGVMAGRQVFAAIPLVSGDNLQITYKFAFA